jgi:RNA polymerase sigma factor (sigma-70 family)
MESKTTEQYSDLQIIEKVIAGETALFEILIRRNNPSLYKTGRSYNLNHEDTQDLMQETLIQAYANLSKFENRSSFKTWIIRIMLHNCYQKKQKLSFKSESPNEITEKATPMFSNSHTDTQRNVVNRELHFVIENALQQLPEEYRMVFSLREINGFNVAETAETLNISEGNVKVRLNRAKAMLRTVLEKSYSTDDIFEFNLIYCDAIVNNVMARIHELHQQSSNKKSAL